MKDSNIVIYKIDNPYSEIDPFSGDFETLPVFKDFYIIIVGKKVLSISRSIDEALEYVKRFT